MKILVVDFGSQYTHLIYHKIKYRLGLEVELTDCHQFNPKKDDLTEYDWIVLSGGPGSVEEMKMDWTVKENLLNHNVLGICFGAQLLAKEQGYDFETRVGEYGPTPINFLYDNIDSIAWMSHQDFIVIDPEKKHTMDFIAANSDNHPVAWEFNNSQGKQRIGLQFHPEVDHTEGGLELLGEVFEIEPENIINDCLIMFDQLKDNITNKIKPQDRLFLAISGGVDSSTLGLLLSKCCHPDQLQFYLVDNGLMRKNEVDQVFKSLNTFLPSCSLKLIDASNHFLSELADVEDPEKKRKIIGHAFIDVFSQQIKESLEKSPLKDDGQAYFVQGTIYPDVIESGKTKFSKTIKSHHNVGGLPETLPCTLLEPFRELYKDDVRNIAQRLRLPSEITKRHPFPGPGLAIRILGAITKEKIEIVQNADFILRTSLREFDLESAVWQAAAILLPIKSVGVKGDNRSYEEVIVLRMVNSTNGMTANPSLIPIDKLIEIGNRIQKGVQGVNRVVYDLSSKPPATIEWE